MKVLKSLFTYTKKAIGISLLKQQAGFIKKVTDKSFTVDTQAPVTTFSMLHNMGIDEKKLTEAMQGFMRLTIVFLCLAVIVLLYSIYILITSSLLTFIICLLVVVLMLANAFKYHFWYMQIKQRKLGCSVKEWWEYTVASIKGLKSNLPKKK